MIMIETGQQRDKHQNSFNCNRPSISTINYEIILFKKQKIKSIKRKKTKRTIFELKQTVARIYKCFPFPLFFLFYSFHFVWTEKNQILHFDHTHQTHTHRQKSRTIMIDFRNFFFHISLLFIIFFSLFLLLFLSSF